MKFIQTLIDKLPVCRLKDLLVKWRRSVLQHQFNQLTREAAYAHHSNLISKASAQREIELWVDLPCMQAAHMRWRLEDIDKYKKQLDAFEIRNQAIEIEIAKLEAYDAQKLDKGIPNA